MADHFLNTLVAICIMYVDVCFADVVRRIQQAGIP